MSSRPLTEHRSIVRRLTGRSDPESPVALCDGHGALLVAASGMLVAAHTGRRRGPTQDRAAEESGCSRSLAEASSCSPADGSSYNEVANNPHLVLFTWENQD